MEKKTIYYPFLVDEKGYFFPKLPYEMVTVKDGNGKGQNMINPSIYKKYNSLMCQQLFLLIKCPPGNSSTS